MAERFTRYDVFGENGDVLLAVQPGVFVLEAQRVQDLMGDVPHRALGRQKHLLLPASVAHEGRTSGDDSQNQRFVKQQQPAGEVPAGFFWRSEMLLHCSTLQVIVLWKNICSGAIIVRG